MAVSVTALLAQLDLTKAAVMTVDVAATGVTEAETKAQESIEVAKAAYENAQNASREELSKLHVMLGEVDPTTTH